jgi:hypothetical protein
MKTLLALIGSSAIAVMMFMGLLHERSRANVAEARLGLASVQIVESFNTELNRAQVESEPFKVELESLKKTGAKPVEIAQAKSEKVIAHDKSIKDPNAKPPNITVTPCILFEGDETDFEGQIATLEEKNGTRSVVVGVQLHRKNPSAIVAEGVLRAPLMPGSIDLRPIVVPPKEKHLRVALSTEYRTSDVHPLPFVNVQADYRVKGPLWAFVDVGLPVLNHPLEGRGGIKLQGEF